MNHFCNSFTQFNQEVIKSFMLAMPAYSLGIFVTVFAATISFQIWEDDISNPVHEFKIENRHNFIDKAKNQSDLEFSKVAKSDINSYSLEIVENDEDQLLYDHDQNNNKLMSQDDEFSDIGFVQSINSVVNKANSSSSRIFTLLNNIVTGGGSSSPISQSNQSANLSNTTSRSNNSSTQNDTSQQDTSANNSELAQNSRIDEIESYKDALEAIKAERRKQVCLDWHASGKSLASLQLSEQYLITETFKCI